MLQWTWNGTVDSLVLTELDFTRMCNKLREYKYSNFKLSNIERKTLKTPKKCRYT